MEKVKIIKTRKREDGNWFYIDVVFDVKGQRYIQEFTYTICKNGVLQPYSYGIGKKGVRE